MEWDDTGTEQDSFKIDIFIFGRRVLPLVSFILGFTFPLPIPQRRA